MRESDADVHLEKKFAAVADEVGADKQQVTVGCAEEDGPCGNGQVLNGLLHSTTGPFILQIGLTCEFFE
jgi:hypothetical protein